MIQLIFRKQSHCGRFCSDPNAQRRRQSRPGLAWRLIVVCAGFLVIGSAAFSANDVSSEPPAIPAVQADAELAALLLQVEQQIFTGHAFSPPGDSALNTWPRVVQRAVPTSPGARRALADFVSRVGNRAADEKAAGRADVWIDLTLFKDLATTMLTDAAAAPESSSNSQTATSQPMPVDQAAPGAPVAEAVEINRIGTPASGASTGPSPLPSLPDPTTTSAGPAPAEMANRIGTPASGASTGPSPSPSLPDPTTTSAGPAPTPLGNPAASQASPAMGAADMNAGHPAPAAGKTALAIVIPATRTPTAEEQSMAAMYASRGDEMLAIKDISAARKFYEYAANAGSARAATALAKSYDPAFLTQLGAVGIRPDPALAAAWYGRAVALGDSDAAARLRTQSAK
jgi:hypothetical protein